MWAYELVCVCVPQHGCAWIVEGFEGEKTIPCRHSWAIESHQSIKLLQRHSIWSLNKRHKCRFITLASVLKKQVICINLTCRLTSSWKACSMADRLCKSRDLNFIFSTPLKVSKTTARSCEAKTIANSR